jgi:muconolactone delta-isomerase
LTSLPDIAADIEPASAEPYLRATGWELAHQGKLGNRWRLKLPGRVRNVAVPLSLLDADDHTRMFSAMLEVLAEVEDRDPAAIARDVSNAAFDLLEFRLIAESLRDGEMPLRAAPELTGGAYDAVMAAARSEVARRPHFAQGTLPTSVRTFVDSAVLAGTARGSVILRVKPQVPQEANPPRLEGLAEPDPFERRAVSRLLHGVQAAKYAAHSDFAAADDSALDEAVEAGLSANLCDALLKLAGTKTGVDAIVGIRVRWALTRPIRPTDRVADEVQIERAELGQLDFIAERL